MQRIHKVLSDVQQKLLASYIGANLLGYEAVFAGPNLAWNTVRVHTSRGSFDIHCFLEALPVNDDGDTDEFGILSVCESDDSLLEVDDISADTTSLEIGKEIVDVGIVTNTLDSFYDNEQLVHRENVQAVFFELDDGSFMVLDREVWFEETLTIKQGHNLESLIYDDSESWENDLDDPETRFEYSSRIERLQ